ncbi:MAG: hypothetical protein AAGG75_28340, partial [Bacteroidota bacterium]
MAGIIITEGWGKVTDFLRLWRWGGRWTVDGETDGTGERLWRFGRRGTGGRDGGSALGALVDGGRGDGTGGRLRR